MSEVVHRAWGCYEVIYREHDLQVKILRMEPRSMTSLQRHKGRVETFVTVLGEPEYWGEFSILSADNKATGWHQIINRHESPAVIVEVQQGDCREENIERK